MRSGGSVRDSISDARAWDPVTSMPRRLIVIGGSSVLRRHVVVSGEAEEDVHGASPASSLIS